MDDPKPQRKQDSADGVSKREEALAAKKRGNTAFSNKDWKGAIKEFTDAIALDPTDHVFYSNRSGCYAQLGDYETALKDAQKCVETKPDWPKGYSRTGLALYQLRKYEEAKTEYEKGLKISPDNAALKQGLDQATKAIEREANPMAKMFDDSMWGKLHNDPVTREYLKDDAFRTKLEMCKQNPQMMSSLIGSDEKMRAAFGVLIGIGSSFGAPKGDASSEDKESGSASASEPAGKKEAKKNSTSETKEMEVSSDSDSAEEVVLDSDMTDAEKDERKRKAEEKKRLYEEKKKKKEALAEKVKGNQFYKEKKYDKAITHYEKAIELDPKECVYLLNKAAAVSMKKEYQTSIDLCKEALKIGQENSCDFTTKAKAYFRMGNAYKSLDKLDEAVDAYEKSLLESHDRKVKAMLKKTKKILERRAELAYHDDEKSDQAKQRGNTFFKESKWVEAIEEYSEAIKRNPKNHAAFCNRAACYMKLMDWQRGIDDCDAAIKIKPDYIKAYTRKGRTQHFRKEYHKALETYDAGLVHAPDNADLKEDKRRTMIAIEQENSSGNVDPKRAEAAMKDPEIQAILRDQEIMTVLKNAQSNPAAAQEAFKNPEIAKKIQKLVNAGVLQMGKQ